MTTNYKQPKAKPTKRVKDTVGVYAAKTSLHVVDAVFDGSVLRPISPLFLKPNTQARITIEIVKKKRGKSKSFLDVARSAKLKGPRDFSENLDDYLYRGKPIHANEG
jgi:predicted DNA-binding antitoxin AbrB/MazE fold protein